jgi:hypothetical protein
LEGGGNLVDTHLLFQDQKATKQYRCHVQADAVVSPYAQNDGFVLMTPIRRAHRSDEAIESSQRKACSIVPDTFQLQNKRTAVDVMLLSFTVNSEPHFQFVCGACSNRESIMDLSEHGDANVLCRVEMMISII